MALSDTGETAYGRLSSFHRKGYVTSGLNLCTMLMEEEGPYWGKLQIRQVEHLVIALDQIMFLCDWHNLKILKSVFLSHPHNKVPQRLTVETHITCDANPCLMTILSSINCLKTPLLLELHWPGSLSKETWRHAIKLCKNSSKCCCLLAEIRAFWFPFSSIHERLAALMPLLIFH